MYDMAVTGGSVVTPDGVVQGDIAVKNGVIASIGVPVVPSQVTGRVIDAKGKLVLPGVIDAHVHCQTWTDHADAIGDSHRSAAFGGVTTAITQIRAPVDMAPSDAISYFISEGERTSPIDFGLHTILRPEHDAATEVPKVMALGSPSVKFFMSYKDNGIMTPDATLLRNLRIVAENGGLAMVHAEDGEILAHLIDHAKATGRTRLEDFAWTHPAAAEDLGVHKALAYAKATDCPLYILHMTTKGGVKLLREAAAAGQRVFGETCPKYLTLTNDDLLRVGAQAKVGPPLRSDDDREHLWDALKTGTLSVVASDHAPRARERTGQVDDVFAEPYGAPGAETMLPVIYDELVVKRRGSVSLLAEILSTNPARIYGLYPKKGIIAAGSDADLVLVDPERREVISAATQHSTATYSLYEGREVTGWPTLSTVRGRVVLDNGELKQQPAFGKYQHRSLPESVR
ncbi:amidohydrolase family protein [Streptomyces sp. NPDC052109]|uniref:dihydroorotase n=1 Tax=Streptomyces sp. NPDC052109 TaxID=3155527 RepID=UPI00342D9043